MNELSPWVQKLVAVALLVSLLAVVWGSGIAPLCRWSQAAVEELQEARFEAARLAQAAEAAKNISEARIAELERTVASYTVPGTSEAEAMTLAQGFIDRLMKENRLALESIQSIPPSTVGTLRRIGFSLRAHGSESKMIDFLAAAESNLPLLKLESLTLRAVGPGADGTIALAPKIFIEATIFAYWRPPMVLNGR